MKLFRVTSSSLPEIYVFAHDQYDAEEIYRSFKMLLDWTQDAFQIEHVDRQPGWKQNRTLKRLLKAGTRGVAKPHPRSREWLTEASRWMIWAPPDAD
jgi:hypothetical protein